MRWPTQLCYRLRQSCSTVPTSVTGLSRRLMPLPSLYPPRVARLSVSAGRERLPLNPRDGSVGLDAAEGSVCFLAQYGVDAVADRRDGRRAGIVGLPWWFVYRLNDWWRGGGWLLADLAGLVRALRSFHIGAGGSLYRRGSTLAVPNRLEYVANVAWSDSALCIFKVYLRKDNTSDIWQKSYGKELSAKLKLEMADEEDLSPRNGRVSPGGDPRGEDPGSVSYVDGQVAKASAECGHPQHHDPRAFVGHYAPNCWTSSWQLNLDDEVDGILVQLPLPGLSTRQGDRRHRQVEGR